MRWQYFDQLQPVLTTIISMQGYQEFLLNGISGSNSVSSSFTLMLLIYISISKVKIEFCYPQDENRITYSAFTFGMAK